MLRRQLLAASAASLMVFGAAACGGTTKDNSSDTGGSQASASANPNAQLKTGLKIAYLPKQLNNPYSDVETSGGEAAVKELQGEYKKVGPNDASASSQVSYINTLIQQQQDVIVIAANDPNAVCPVAQPGPRREDQGRHVRLRRQPEDCRDAFINQATTEGIGAVAGEDGLRPGRRRGRDRDPVGHPERHQPERLDRGGQGRAKKPEYAKLKLVKIAYGNDDDQKSFQEAQGLLQSYPNLKVIVAPTTVGIAAAARYVSSSSYKGKVQVTGLGLPNQMREYVKDGTVKVFALWNPADIGYLAAYAGAAMASGQITGKEGDKFKAGKLGDYTVGKDGEIVLGPPTEFTPANIDQFNF